MGKKTTKTKKAAKKPAKKKPTTKKISRPMPAKRKKPSASRPVRRGASAGKSARPKARPRPSARVKVSVRKPAAPKRPAKPVKMARERVGEPLARKAPAPSKKPAPPAPPPPAPRPKTKILSREFLIELAGAIRDSVVPLTREGRGREIVGTAASGDATFELDRVAEKTLLTFLKNARMPVAYYSENAGYTTFTNTQPQNLLVVDPVDGTRAAKSGFEGCVVSIASTRVIERPCMADVDNAVVMEILGDRTFYAERGKGIRITQDDHLKRYKLSKNASLETVAWSMTVPGRPAQLIFGTAAKLIDLTSLKGGFFICNSTSFSLTRLLTNQLDACVDIANRFMRDVPELVKDHFINAGRGVVIGIAPYDLAAALLIAQEGGCIVTDAYGNNFNDVLLLDTSVPNQRSLIAAANPELHEKLVTFFDMRIKQWEDLVRRRAENHASES